jgi:hypothetical protein
MWLVEGQIWSIMANRFFGMGQDAAGQRYREIGAVMEAILQMTKPDLQKIQQAHDGK